MYKLYIKIHNLDIFTSMRLTIKKVLPQLYANQLNLFKEERREEKRAGTDKRTDEIVIT